jgi:hypothetical protein
MRRPQQGKAQALVTPSITGSSRAFFNGLLTSTDHPVVAPHAIPNHSPDRHWYLLPANTRSGTEWLLGPLPDVPWLRLYENRIDSTSQFSFSGDSRFLTWGTESGVILIVDLPALHTHVEEFEAGLHDW